MTTMPDLAPYTYGPTPAGVTVLAVGWLEADPSTSGSTDTVVADRLLHLIATGATRRTRGAQQCLLGSPGHAPYPVTATTTDGSSIVLGSAELWLTDPSDPTIVYAAPTLVHHYLTDHGYQPPEPFLAAIEHGEAIDPDA